MLVSHIQEFWISSWWRRVSYARLMHCGCVASANGLAPLSSLNSIILQEMHDNQVHDLRSNYQCFTRVRWSIDCKELLLVTFPITTQTSPWSALCKAYMRESETMHTRVASVVCWCVSQLPFQLQADQEAQKNTRYFF